MNIYWILKMGTFSPILLNTYTTYMMGNTVALFSRHWTYGQMWWKFRQNLRLLSIWDWFRPGVPNLFFNLWATLKCNKSWGATQALVVPNKGFDWLFGSPYVDWQPTGVSVWQCIWFLFIQMCLHTWNSKISTCLRPLGITGFN